MVDKKTKFRILCTYGNNVSFTVEQLTNSVSYCQILYVQLSDTQKIHNFDLNGIKTNKMFIM